MDRDRISRAYDWCEEHEALKDPVTGYVRPEVVFYAMCWRKENPDWEEPELVRALSHLASKLAVEKPLPLDVVEQPD